ncbi:MAG: type II toxin-antitoxin system HicB family antitoxin [Phototrophicaceae bacterium]
MPQVRDTLTITVEYFDGQAEDDVGYPYYVATNDEIGLVTDGKTFEELRRNLAEALDLCLGDVDTLAEYHLVPNPRIELRMMLPYGQTA